MSSTIFAAVIAAGIVALIALRLRALTLSGAFAATIVGALVLAGGGLSWGSLLLLFFITSSVASILPLRSRHSDTGIVARSHQRDAIQVVANGGAPALYALLSILLASPIWVAGFAGGIAAATADTWATEIGAYSLLPPRLITTGRPVPAGTSGGITPLGLAAAGSGAALIGLAAALLPPRNGWYVVTVTLGGIIGSLADSVIGATLQEKRHCQVCDVDTEQAVHRSCDSRTEHVGGIQGVTNDIVNVAACVLGSLVALALSTLT